MSDELAAGLRPVHGDPASLLRLLEPWLADDSSAALVVRTSGSTGAPKDVVLSRRAVHASAVATLARIGGPGQWTLALPTHYVAGLQVLTRSVLAGASPVELERDDTLSGATARLTAARRYLACVPTQLYRWLEDPSDRAALAAYDVVLLGGQASPPSLLAAARAAGVAVVTTYGMSETCGGCVYDGWPLDGVGVALDADNRIRVAGPVLFDGYAAPDRTDDAAPGAVLRDGWFHTGDLGRFDPDGRLVVLGRADDVVVSGGVNVSLSAVRERIAAHAAVHDAVVLGRPDPEWGHVVTAVVVSDRELSRDEIRDFVSERLPRTWAPRDVVRVARLPMLATGKVDHQAVRAEILGEPVTEPAP